MRMDLTAVFANKKKLMPKLARVETCTEEDVQRQNRNVLRQMDQWKQIAHSPEFTEGYKALKRCDMNLILCNNIFPHDILANEQYFFDPELKI
jgi:hypothetical protein